jgi:hypothetical protein
MEAGMTVTQLRSRTYEPPAAVADERDPIFAAIEEYTAAYIKDMAISRATGDLNLDDPANKRAKHELAIAGNARNKCGLALTRIRPTTIEGVFALLAYVEEFNAGGIWLEETRGLPWRDQWRSMVTSWPGIKSDDQACAATEHDMCAFALLSNVHEALKALAVRS